MPEGDTVWLTAHRLSRALAGGTLVRADLRVPRLATADLTGRRVEGVVPRGKHLLTRLGGGLTLHSHLRMDGAWHLYAPGERWGGGPQWQVRAILATAERVAVGYRLPVLELLPTAEEDKAVGHLGPDLLGSGWDPAEAVRRLLADPGRPVGEAPGPDRLVALAHRLLTANKARHGHITTGDTRRGRTHWVYGRADRPCLRCGTLVRTAEHGTPPDRARVAYWCPHCQRGPAPPTN
jgi:endonuclease-8